MICTAPSGHATVCGLPTSETSTDETAGERLSRARRRRKLTQPALADLIGCTEITVRRWESGATKWYGDTLIELSRILGVTPEWPQRGEGLGPANTASSLREFVSMYEDSGGRLPDGPGQ